MKLIFSQPEGAFERAQKWLHRAQNACAADNWTKAVGAYEKAQSLIEGDNRYVNLRGEIFVYMAYCHLFLKQATLADSKLQAGLALMTNELLRIELHDCYLTKRDAVIAGRVAKF